MKLKLARDYERILTGNQEDDIDGLLLFYSYEQNMVVVKLS